MGPLGILGGTFDPPHYGHLAAAEEVCFRLSLSQLVWIPAGDPPHKQHRKVTDAAHRAAMLERAISSNSKFVMSRIEVERRDLSYTVDTLTALRALHPGRELVFIMGSDEFASLSTWHRPEMIPQLAFLAIMRRSGVAFDPLEVEERVPTVRGRYEILEVPDLPISSSDLRARRRLGLPLRYFTPDPVVHYIEAHGLYLEEEASF